MGSSLGSSFFGFLFGFFLGLLLDGVQAVQVDLPFVDQLEQDVRHLGIELGAPAFLNFSQHIAEIHLLAVHTVGGHGIESVGHADDAGEEGDFLALDAGGIALAVVALVMMQGPFHNMVDEGEIL